MPATAARMAHQSWWNALSALTSGVNVVLGVRSSLRRPRELTVLAIAGEAPTAVFYGLRGAPGRAAAQAEDRRRLSLVVAGAVARLRAASAEPLP